MAQKIIIFGAKGTLGRELTREFLENNYDVSAFDKEDIDITSDILNKFISDIRPNIIINATGYNKVDIAEREESERKIAYAINAEAPKVMAEAAKKIDAVFVNYSTDYVFDGVKTGGYDEDDVPNPLSEYGKSKFAGEQNIISVGNKFYIIRPSRIFGRLNSEGTGKKSFVEIMLERAELPEIKVVSDERGSPTYAPDLASLTLSLIKNNLPYGIYHGANSGSCSWFEWAQEIFRLSGKTPQLIPISAQDYNSSAKRPADSTLISNKVQPQRSWLEALNHFFLNRLS